MGRIRTIKPEFFKHEGLFEAEKETGLPLRLAFAGLWTCCDREGRFKWRPRTLKLDVLPYDDVDFGRVLDALSTRGYVVKYASLSGDLGWIPTFLSHQVINNRESASFLASYTESADSTRQPRVNHASTTPLVQEQVEGKGREGEMEGEKKEKSAQEIEKPPILSEKRANHFPSWEQVRELFRMTGGTYEQAFAFFGHHEDSAWVDSHGRPLHHIAGKVNGWIAKASEKEKTVKPQSKASGSGYVSDGRDE